MSTAAGSRPIPVPDDLTSPFWEAARQGRLSIQRCSACGYYNHPPQVLCDRCSSDELAFTDVSGLGAVYSFTVMFQKNVAGFENKVPYTNLLVELDEQPQLLLVSDLPGDGADISIGQRVCVEFEELDGGIMLPKFRTLE